MDRSEQLFEAAKRVLPGGVNSPVRAFRAVGMAPRFITLSNKNISDPTRLSIISFGGLSE